MDYRSKVNNAITITHNNKINKYLLEDYIDKYGREKERIYY